MLTSTRWRYTALRYYFSICLEDWIKSKIASHDFRSSDRYYNLIPPPNISQKFHLLRQLLNKCVIKFITSLKKHWQRKQRSEGGNYQFLDENIWGRLCKFKNLRRTRRTQRKRRKKRLKRCNNKKGKSEIRISIFSSWCWICHYHWYLFQINGQIYEDTNWFQRRHSCYKFYTI